MFADLHEGVLNEFAERAARSDFSLDARLAHAAERERERQAAKRAAPGARERQHGYRAAHWAAVKADPAKRAERNARECARRAAKRAARVAA
jgi:hypothetical protein